MELPHRKPNRIGGYDYSQNGAYFVTICTQGRKKILSQIVGTPLPGCPHDPTVKLLRHGEIADTIIVLEVSRLQEQAVEYVGARKGLPHQQNHSLQIHWTFGTLKNRGQIFIRPQF